jgi:hypothetical protein
MIFRDAEPQGWLWVGVCGRLVVQSLSAWEEDGRESRTLPPAEALDP